MYGQNPMCAVLRCQRSWREAIDVACGGAVSGFLITVLSLIGNGIFFASVATNPGIAPHLIVGLVSPVSSRFCPTRRRYL